MLAEKIASERSESLTVPNVFCHHNRYVYISQSVVSAVRYTLAADTDLSIKNEIHFRDKYHCLRLTNPAENPISIFSCVPDGAPSL